MEMDLQDWELLASDGDDAGGGGVFLGFERGKGLSAKETTGLGPKGLVDVNYFVCPREPAATGEKKKKNRPDLGLAPAKSGPVVEKKTTRKKPEEEEERVKDIKEIVVATARPPPVVTLSAVGVAVANQDVVSQVFFRKNEFADMKMDSPRSPGTTSTARPQAEEKIEESRKCDQGSKQEGSKMISSEEGGDEEEGKGYMGSEIRAKGEEGCWEGFGFGIWKWRVTGIGALCSVGVAAATICILILGGRGQRQKQHQQQGQNLQFQIYTDEKSIKQVVHHATRLNHAISAVRGVPTTRAHISFGGYYNGL